MSAKWHAQYSVQYTEVSVLGGFAFKVVFMFLTTCFVISVLLLTGTW